ncbi:RNA polymerase subunit sigma-70 [Nonomuraea sp. 3N208]|uniref:RNA polymerase subunit sigma-70 n=1 Tax=Nonomuraea sp. 3N208 TaxID=3457421 RepID=UPI003FCE935D
MGASEQAENAADPDNLLPGPEADDFAELVRRHRRELHLHCYRMLGSFDEAEDHVQDVLLRAWRSRESFQGRSSVRTWLYRIATNACLDTLRRDARRAAPALPGPSAAPAGSGPSVAGMPWLQPYPDQLLDELAGDQPGPEAVAVNRETMSLAFLATIQLLPPRQRAVVILRDVGDWSAAETAVMLDMTVPAVNSALQRARATLREQWPGGRLEWAPAAQPDPGHRRLLQTYIAAHEHADPEMLIAVLRHDIRLAISPQVGEWQGRDDVAAALRRGMNSLGRWRLLPISANGQLGAAGYLRPPGESVFVPFVLALLRFDQGALVDVAAFEQPSLFRRFGLPACLTGDGAAYGASS